MIIKHLGQRVGVFIDIQNLYHSAKNLYQSRVNFEEVLKFAIGGRSLIRAFAYVVRTKTGEERPFFDALVSLGIETRIRDLQEFFGGQKKADWDVGIVIDAIRTSPGLDVIVLVKNQGKRVEVIAFDRSASKGLKEIADEFIDMEKNTDKYLLHAKRNLFNLKIGKINIRKTDPKPKWKNSN